MKKLQFLIFFLLMGCASIIPSPPPTPTMLPSRTPSPTVTSTPTLTPTPTPRCAVNSNWTPPVIVGGEPVNFKKKTGVILISDDCGTVWTMDKKLAFQGFQASGGDRPMGVMWVFHYSNVGGGYVVSLLEPGVTWFMVREKGSIQYCLADCGETMSNSLPLPYKEAVKEFDSRLSLTLVHWRAQLDQKQVCKVSGIPLNQAASCLPFATPTP